MRGLSHKSLWVVALVVSLAIVVVAAVQAAIPDPSGAIHACYRSNGNLRWWIDQVARAARRLSPGTKRDLRDLRALLDLRAHRA